MNRENGTNRAQVLADWYSAKGDGIIQACIYMDGMIVYLVTTEETQKRVEWALGKAVEESARSGDGFCGVLVLNNRYRRRRNLERVHLVTGELCYTDNRDKDANTIDAFVRLVTGGE